MQVKYSIYGRHKGIAIYPCIVRKMAPPYVGVAVIRLLNAMYYFGRNLQHTNYTETIKVVDTII